MTDLQSFVQRTQISEANSTLDCIIKSHTAILQNQISALDDKIKVQKPSGLEQNLIAENEEVKQSLEDSTDFSDIKFRQPSPTLIEVYHNAL